jgi:opacity protein-like surface antigen
MKKQIYLLSLMASLFVTPLLSAQSLTSTDRGTYIEGLIGYNRYAFRDITIVESDIVNLNIDNEKGNLALGATIGYQHNRYLAVEGGGIYAFKAKYSFESTTTGAVFNNLSARPWYAYLAGRITLEIMDHLNIFTKLGLGFQRLVLGSPHLGSSESNWGAMFGGGLIYHFTPTIYINGQWMRFTGKVKNAIPDTSASNVFLLGLGYKFII